MKFTPFKLERYFAKFDPLAKHLLCNSDCEPFSMTALLELADDETRDLWNGLQLHYTSPWGHPSVREEIAKLYDDINPDQVLVAAPEEGIFVALQCILEKGDHMVSTFPGYQSLYEIGNSIGCNVSKWEPRENDNWRFDPADLESQLTPNTKLIVINSPHNPTGTTLSKEDFNRVIELASQRNAYVFFDEMYRYLEFDASDRLSDPCQKYERALCLGGMSKAFGLPGLRIGWVVTKDAHLLNEMSTFKDYTTICSSAPSEILSIVALRAKDRIVEQQLTRLRNNLSILDNFFAHHQGLFDVVKPRGGSILFPRMNIDESVYDMCVKLVQTDGIMLIPGRVFDYGDSHLRIGFGREDFKIALDRFSAFLDKNY